MKILKKKIVYNGRYIKVIEKEFLSKSGKRGVWETVERKIYKGVIIIFALTEKKEVILEKIYRVPQESFVIELPAALTDKKGESRQATVRRELLEETGYKAIKVTPVFTGVISPGLVSHQRTIFFVPKTKFVGRRKLEKGEEIEVIKVPLKGLVDFLMNPPKGTKVDIETLAVLPILKKKGLI